jgi:NAD(P)-binding Rossmann-like domain
MKAVVVGSGITGCVSAIHLRNKGFDVDIYDSAKNIGGVLNDIVIDNEIYFNGCQYFNSNTKWLVDILDEIGSQLVHFDLSYGSYSETLNDVLIHDDFAGPVFNAEPDLINDTKNTCPDLRSRLEKYPEKIAGFMSNWISRYVEDLSQIHESCAIGIQSSRVYLDYNDSELISLKKGNKFFDEIYGVPRSILNPHVPRANVCLPKYGFNVFFDELKSYIKNAGINVLLESPVTPKNTDTCIPDLFCRNKKLKADLIVWAGNPVPIINACGIGKLDNPSCRMILLVCEFDTKFESNIAHYIQVFSLLTNITRIYFYKINDVYKATIECFYSKDFDEDITVSYANEILNKSGYDFKLKLKGIIKQKRHVFFTLADMKKFDDFEVLSGRSNIVGGGWKCFARDEKIEVILDDIKKKIEN